MGKTTRKKSKASRSSANDASPSGIQWVLITAVAFGLIYYANQLYVGSKNESTPPPAPQPIAQSKPAAQKTAASVSAKSTTKAAQSSTVSIRRPKRGTPLKTVVSLKGKPADKTSFRMKKCCEEHNQVLKRDYSPEKDSRVKIREYTWEYPNNNLLIVWFHKVEGKWVTLRSSRRKGSI